MGQPAWQIEPVDTALLVIDMQRDFCSPQGYAARAGLDVARLAEPITHIRRLLDAARRAGMLVVHTREGHSPDLSDCTTEKMRRSLQAGAPIGSAGPMGRLLVRGEYGHDFIDALQPAAGEVVIDKPGYGAFYQTDLALVLSNRRISQLILCGVTTEVCVHSTLREAVDRGYACLTVADATAAFDPALQAPALAMIGVEGGIFGRVATTDQLLVALQGAHVHRDIP
ncbi:MAG TPA: cysteine hydrolase [Polaromonas sp.]|uniref:cysteine hydrolase family protein n=1 Tax=Polaromonas sp. UBA4122 TaxID=1947074 RepID=UPI000ED84307|nr:isochorismatase family cysteine hydrolase [Polaromonas sp. UBA4122]HAL37505.1 cysteine hydrolase [Polaromonas sp.]